MYLLIYVDEMLIDATNMFEINRLKDELSGEFKMKDLGVAKKILSMDICMDGKIEKLYLS